MPLQPDDPRPPELPPDHPRRAVLLEPGGATLWVPMHVSRADVELEGRTPSRGWQVRYRGTGAFFVERYGDNPEDSLRRAETYLASILGRPPPRSAVKPHKRIRLDRSSGVQMVVRPNRRVGTAKEVVFEVTNPGTGRAKVIYAGTERSVTQGQLQRALSRAFALRDELVRRHRNR